MKVPQYWRKKQYQLQGTRNESGKASLLARPNISVTREDNPENTSAKVA